MTETRRIIFVSPGMPTSDGAGVKLTRMLGTQQLPDLDPFLMLDHFRSGDANDYIAGFPDHPHRGFETVTIMKEGRMRHRDSRGNEGVVAPGGIQWMTTGRGLIHSEMPEQTEGRMSGFQLWVNLPASHKMIEPDWHDHPAETVPSETLEGAKVRILAGGEGPGRSAGPDADIRILDVELEAGATFREALPHGHNAFLAVYGGNLQGIHETPQPEVKDPAIAVLSRGDEVALRGGPEGAHFLLVAGQPIGEPIARHGPFVMNTQNELREAFNDFQSGRLG
ncbi:pirin family protein [Parvularcula sp. ZS-1/3]|uniref:Pirin family protein n=1 Tax=Parvularcula mediterranea TaxID=2732508 RepID=A0A7Y3RL52_9PROT|nr:pirin family protein [Parvularcula mediterranea]NNU16083.1 pirin family protein [Parvularcula mediterranea]